MGCCGDKIKRTIQQVDNIRKGWTNYMLGRDMNYTKAVLLACRQCKNNHWLGIRKVCAICHCWIPAKSRVPPKIIVTKDENGNEVKISEYVSNCRLGKWPKIEEIIAQVESKE